MIKVEWMLEDTAFCKERIVQNGNAYLLGNGYMGYRGTLEEYAKSEMTAINLAGLYDKCDDKWRETVNAPNGLYTRIFCDGQPVSLPESMPRRHTQILDIHSALHSRDTVWDTQSGAVRVIAERFVSMADPHLICLRYSVRFEQAIKAEIVTGIDSNVWDINGPHLDLAHMEETNGVLSLWAQTRELGITVATAEAVTRTFDACETISREPKGIFRHLSFQAEPDTEYMFYKFFCVYTGRDNIENPVKAALFGARSAATLGYAACLARHTDRWTDLWANSDMVIEGDPESQFAIRYSIYQLLILAPRHRQGVSIAARGLSGQTYKGAVFWDTEMFLLPFYLHTDPDIARGLIAYRVLTLDGAKRKAQAYGFRGAYYAWESQETGDDACSDYNVTDVFTKRPMRTYFRDKQVHISADVALATWSSYEFLGEDGILLNGGAEVILECARFFYSYASYKADRNRYEIHDVIGPDEYHERVNNNAFTNRVIWQVLDVALQCARMLSEKYPNTFRTLLEKLQIADELNRFADMRDRLFLQQPDLKTGLIEQFDGYFGLEDATLDQVRSRLLDPKEYWGGGNGIASGTQIIKQADVMLMLWLFRGEYPQSVIRSNWRFYEPRTEHGSSLSPCIYALTACETGNSDWAYPYFLKSAEIDFLGGGKQFAGSVYIGGTHPAANGGAWMVAAFGFAGLCIKNEQISVSPRLPEKWARLEFSIVYKGEKYKISITKAEAKVWKISYN